MTLGSVYFIQEGADGCIKIGWTSGDVERRLQYLQVGNSRKLFVRGTVPGVEQSVEFDWQTRFGEHHARAEWFFPAPALLSAIRTQCEPPTEKPSKPVPVNFNTFQPLAAWMVANNVNQRRLAHLSGLSTAYVSQIVNGDRELNLGVARRFEVATGGAVKAAALLGLEEAA